MRCNQKMIKATKKSSFSSMKCSVLVLLIFQGCSGRSCRSWCGIPRRLSGYHHWMGLQRPFPP